MKIGVISDIHNNPVALDQMLEYFSDNGCEKIICCGDIVSIGPMPEETVRRIMGIENLICVKGNHEDYLRKIGLGESLFNDMQQDEARYHEWEFDRLSQESKVFLDSLPASRFETIEGIKIYIAHYAMSQNAYLNPMRSLTLQMCEEMFSDISANVVLFGHSHKYFYFTSSNTHYINVPSLGCPSKSKNVAHAGILEIGTGTCGFNKVDLEYDVSAVIAQIDRFNYPASKEIKQIFFGLQ